MHAVVRYFALACDYDGTIARHGHVEDATIAGIERLRASGRTCVLVTGRELEDLKRVFPHVQLFDCIVAENGALVYEPRTRKLQQLAEAPLDEFIQELTRRGVAPLSVGHVIVATWEPNDHIVLQVIHDMGLELQLTFNKGAVMVLPSGVNKATGLRRALEALGLSPHNTSASAMPRTTTPFWPRASTPLRSAMRSTASRHASTSLPPRTTVPAWWN